MEQYLTFISNHPILTGVWLVLFFALVYNLMQSRFSPFTRVNTQVLTQLVNKQDGVVVDIRGKEEFRKGHIAGAKNILLSQIEQGNFEQLEKHKQTPIILVCTAGLTATKGANKLAQAGFEQLNVLDGGMNAWQNANLPVAKA